MTKKNRKRNRKKKQLLSGQSNYPSKCPLCGSKTMVRNSRRTKQKFVGCLGFPGCNWSYNLNFVASIVPKYIPPSFPKAEVGEMEKYYNELQLLCDVGDEEARDEMDKLEKRFGIVYA